MRIKKIHYLISLLLGSLLSACPSPNLSNETTTTIISNSSASSSSSTSIFSNKKPINRGLHGALPSTDPNQNSSNNISNDPYPYATSSSPPVYYSSNPYPSVVASASTYRPDLPASAAPSTSASSGANEGGIVIDIKEHATFNGGIYDNNGLPVNGVKVTAQSIDPAINWKGEDQVTSNGSYVFRNAPVGVRIIVSVTVNGVTKSQTQVLKSNLTGDINQNRIDFNNVYYTDYRPLEGRVYDANQNLITSDVEVIGESTDSSNPWNSKAEFNNGLYKFSQIPLGVKNLKITVKAKGKEVSRTYTYNDSLAYNYVNFGGSESQDKTFAIQRFRIKDLATGINLFKNTVEEAESTFATDVDTASYTLMRNSINNANSLPSQDSVRIEDYINYFDYEYPKPQKSFSINTEIAQSPFVKDSTKKILRIGLQGKEIKIENRKDAIITFVIDISGSMEENSKLENIKNSIKIFLKQLTPKDRISIVSYNYSAKVIIDNLDISKENEILEAVDNLQPDGGTDIESGLIKGSGIAQKNYVKGAINRILLCSDGANNDLKKDPKIILENIKKQSEVSGISFSSIGVGFNTYNDSFLENVAKNGDGYYAYIDNVKEAVKVFVENATDTLQVIAKDAKVQVKFNPKIVKSYRLIGYEHNILPTNDFRNNNINAGEIGPNHSVTALYEIEINNASNSDKIADVIMRYKDIDLNESVIELSKPVLGKEIKQSFNDTSYSFKLASIVALYGEVLRGSYWSLDNKFEDVLDEIRALENVKNNDKLSELKKLVEKAKSIRDSL